MDLLFTISSPVTVVTDTGVSVYAIHTHPIDTRAYAALINVDVTMGSCKPGLAIAVVKAMARLTVDKVRAICCAHSQS